MELKINQSSLQIPNSKESLVDKARKFQGNDGKIDDNEMTELIADAEKGGMNSDEQEFLAALMDKGVAQEIGKANFNPATLQFQVDDSTHAQHQAKLGALRNQLHTQPELATKASAANQSAELQRKQEALKNKTAAAMDKLDGVVHKHGIVQGDRSKYNYPEEQKFQKKVNGSAGLGATANHCAATVGHLFKEQGFKYPSKFGSTDKAAAFFIYKDYTADKGKGLNPKFAEQKIADEAAGTPRKLFLLKDGADGKMKTYLKSNYPDYDASQNNFDWQNLPIRKGDMVLMNPKSEKPYGPEHAAAVKDYDPATGRMTLLQGNPLAESVYDLSKKSDREKFMGFGRPAPGDFD